MRHTRCDGDGGGQAPYRRAAPLIAIPLPAHPPARTDPRTPPRSRRRLRCQLLGRPATWISPVRDRASLADLTASLSCAMATEMITSWAPSPTNMVFCTRSLPQFFLAGRDSRTSAIVKGIARKTGAADPADRRSAAGLERCAGRRGRASDAGVAFIVAVTMVAGGLRGRGGEQGLAATS